MKRGFVPFVVLAVIGAIVLLTAGAAYTVYKVNHLEKENQRISGELDSQKKAQKENTHVVKNDIATSTSVLATTTDPQKIVPKPVQEALVIPVSKQSPNGIPTKDMIDTIDAWIKNAKSFSGSINEYIATIDYYSGTELKSHEAASTLIGMETDPYLLSEWQYISNITGAVIQMGASLKSGTVLKGSIPNLTSSVNEYIAGLEKKKSEISEYYENDEIYKSKFSKLIDYQSADYSKILDQIYNAQKEYLDTVELSMSKVSEAEPNIKAYMSGRRTSNASIISNTIYQPVIIPQIQIPKTTYCNMSETGARNYYSISCNTY